MALSEEGRFYPPAPVPGRIAPSRWMAHLPFAFWLMEVQKPSTLVELGANTGVAFCAFCQAAKMLGVECNAYAVGQWKGEDGEAVFEDLRDWIEANYASFAYLIRSPFDAALELFRDGTVDLLHLAGQHTCEAIEHNFDSWLPKMSSRGLVLIHDICARIPGYGGVEAWGRISGRFPSFSFRHGYGLGVLITGADAPRSLLDLAAAPETELEEIRGIFHRQGGIYEWIFARELERREEIARLRADYDKLAMDMGRELGNERERHRENVKKLGGMLSDLKAECASQVAELNGELERQRKEFQESMSWRLTAPLRKIGKIRS